MVIRKKRRMNDEEILQKFNELVKQYGNQLPNHIHEPKQFSHYVSLVGWNKELQRLTVDSKPRG